MSDPLELMRESVRALERAIAEGDEPDRVPVEQVLAARTARIAREPESLERSADATTCLVFERSGRRYAVPLTGLSEVAPLGPIARVPGIPPAYLGVAARRGRIVSVVDLPRMFGTGRGLQRAAGEKPTEKGARSWLLMSASTRVVCGVCADEVHDVVDVERSRLARPMPTFPALLQRHALGVVDDGTVVLDLIALLEDRQLRVEERGT